MAAQIHPIRRAEDIGHAVGSAATRAATWVHDYDPFVHPDKIRSPSPSRPLASRLGERPLVPGNIDLDHRPHVKNADGSTSTVRSITVTDDRGRATLLPTVIGKRVVSDDAAISSWRRTGKHLGVFRSEAAANAYAQRLHKAQEVAVALELALSFGPRRAFDFFGAAGYGYDNAYVNGRKPSGMRNVRPTAGAHRDV